MKKFLSKSICHLLLLFCMILLVPGTVHAATPASSFNIHKETYWAWGNWAENVTSSLVYNADGTYTRVEYLSSSNKVIAETYDLKTKKLKSKKTLSMDLPLFGGFYSGKKYNYLVFGQSNPKESNKKEVYRIVQYTKKWKRVAKAGLFGANTYEPFEAGSLRMCEYGNYIYVRTCHEMYVSSDGYHHQANVTFCFNQKTGKITDSFSDVMNLAYCGYVSHSFNQFIQTDTDGTIVAVDHGDAYPRAIVLSKYSSKAGSDSFVSACSSVNVKSFSGSIGDNQTDATVGGLEISKSCYLVAYEYKGSVYLGRVTKSKFSKSGLKTITLAKKSASVTNTTPVLVKLSNSRFVVLWESKKNYNYTGKIKYTVVDAKGKKIGKARSVTGVLSDCQPCVKGKTLTWYVTNNSKPVFYQLNLSKHKLTKKTIG